MKGRAAIATAAIVWAGLAQSARAQSVPGPENYKIRIQGFTWSGDIEGEIRKGLGANDGTLLDGYRDGPSDVTLLGIDPSDVTRYAVAKGYDVIIVGEDLQGCVDTRRPPAGRL
jgi:hypothetical protein